MVRKMLAATGLAAGLTTMGALPAIVSTSPAFAGPICAYVTVTVFATGYTDTQGDCVVRDTSLTTTPQHEGYTIPMVGRIDVSLNRP